MTTFVTTANQTSFQTTMASTNGLNLLNQEQIVVGAGATVSSTQASGISGADDINGTSMLIMGSVLSGGGSTFLFKYAGSLTRSGQQKVLIGSSGAVFGASDGILLSDTASGVGQNFVENRGLVTTAAGTGISAKLSDNYLAYLGTVEAVRGIQAGSSGSSNNVVVNSGSISRRAQGWSCGATARRSPTAA
jgi:hypothetical protein